MLILETRSGDEIRIGDQIEMRVIDTSGGRVRLGFRAPAHIPIHRSEILLKIQQNNGVEVKATNVQSCASN